MGDAQGLAEIDPRDAAVGRAPEENGTILVERRPRACRGASDEEGARMLRVDAQPLHVDGRGRGSATPRRRCICPCAQEQPGHGAHNHKEKSTTSHDVSWSRWPPCSDAAVYPTSGK